MQLRPISILAANFNSNGAIHTLSLSVSASLAMVGSTLGYCFKLNGAGQPSVLVRNGSSLQCGIFGMLGKACTSKTDKLPTSVSSP